MSARNKVSIERAHLNKSRSRKQSIKENCEAEKIGGTKVDYIKFNKERITLGNKNCFSSFLN